VKFRELWGYFLIERVVVDGLAWLAVTDGTPAGTMMWTSSDVLCDDHPAIAAYVHRLAVRRPAAGLGRYLLDWAARSAADHRSNYLRLDCVASKQPPALLLRARRIRPPAAISMSPRLLPTGPSQAAASE